MDKYREHDPTPEDEIDLRQVFAILNKRRNIIAALALGALLISCLVSYLLLPPVYEARIVLMATTATEKLQVQRMDEQDLERVVGSISRLPELTLNTYVEQAKNHVLLERVLEKSGLKDEGYSVGRIRSAISASIIPDTNLIQVRVNDNDPANAALIANTLGLEFVEFVDENNRSRTSQSLVLLREQMQNAELELVAAKEALAAITDRDRAREVRAATLADYQSRLSAARSQREQAQAAIRELEGRMRETTPTLTLDEEETINPVYTSLQTELNRKRQELAELNAQITTLGSSLEQLQNSPENPVNNGYREEELRREIDRLEKNIELFADQYAENQILLSLNIGANTVLLMEPALQQNSPVRPNKQLNMAIGLVLGLMLGVALAFILELFDNKIKTAEDVQKYLGLPVIGTIPRAEQKKKR